MQALSLYENADYGFKMSYPEGWIMQEPEANSMGMVVGFLAPGDDVDNAMDYVTVQTESLPAEQKGTLEQYTQSALQNLRSSYPDLKVLAQGDMTFSGQPGQVVVYAITSGQTPFQVMQAFTIKDSRAYIITFNALADRYSEFEDAAKNMINSFEFI